VVLYDWDGRSIKYHRAEIRQHFGSRECSVEDAEKLTAWLAAEMCESERRKFFKEVREEVSERCRRGVGSGWWCS
jgi:hypothetical protein